MTGTARAPIVVGVDDSAQANRAVRQAAREAAWRNLPLRVVHAFIWPLFNVPLDPPKFGPPEGGLRNQAERIVEQGVDRARIEAPGIEVTAVVTVGAAPPVLIGEADAAKMVVLGSRGLGGFSGLLVGSVAMQVTPHATCPVLVVRGEPTLRGPVVVGVDGSPHSDAALAFAFEEAGWRQTALRAVHAYRPFDSYGDNEPGELGPRLLSESLAGWSDRYPDVPVEPLAIPEQPAPALLDAARDAQLTVVGTRGRGGFSGLLLGSVSQSMLHHAPCPVAVVRHIGDEEDMVG